MIPTEACLACGSTRWKRDASGEFVCPFGHQYHVVEEEGDNDMLFGSQTYRTAIGRRKEKREKVKNYAAIGVAERFFRFQFLLKKQVYWLIEFQKYPKILNHIVRDIWCLWISSLGSLGTTQFEFRNSEIKKRDLPTGLSLVIIRLGASFLRIPLTYLELIQFSFDSDFPFLVEDEFLSTRGVHTNLGSIPDENTLQMLEKKIWNALNVGNNIPAELVIWNMPLTALKLFDLLELPVTLYPHCRTIYDHYSIKTRTPLVGIICLWLSKFVESNASCSLIPSQFRQRNSRILSIATLFSSNCPKPFVDPAFLRFDDSLLGEVQEPEAIKPSKYVKVHESKKIKCYSAEDGLGKVSGSFRNKVRKVSDFFTMDPKWVLMDLSSLEIALYNHQVRK
jgi:hypothetical protein